MGGGLFAAWIVARMGCGRGSPRRPPPTNKRAVLPLVDEIQPGLGALLLHPQPVELSRRQEFERGSMPHNAILDLPLLR